MVLTGVYSNQVGCTQSRLIHDWVAIIVCIVVDLSHASHPEVVIIVFKYIPTNPESRRTKTESVTGLYN